MQRALRSILALALLAGCGPAAVADRGTTPRITTAAGERRVLSLTDLEEARDVAVSPSATWVATDDGILVHEGEGDPRRIGRDAGLPSEDVIAIELEADGTA